MSLGIAGGYPGCNVEYATFRGANADAVPASVEAIDAETRESTSWGPLDLEPGDIQYVRFMGGGGYGDPIDRDPPAALGDVLAGLVTEPAAREIYGVVLDLANERVDDDATRARRLEIRRERIGVGVDDSRATRQDVPRTGRRLSEYLQQDADGRTQCTWCGEAFAPAGEPWKNHAALSRVPVSQAGPRRSDAGGLELIRCCCPACATLLDTDLALPGDGPLHDRVTRWPGVA
jgi:N-methylhydantoinase B